MPVNANNFPMPIVIANQPVASNLSIFDTNFYAVSSYLANVSNQTAGTPYGLANGNNIIYLDVNGTVQLSGSNSSFNSNSSISFTANNNKMFLTTGGELNLPISDYDPFHNSALIQVDGGTQVAIGANGYIWEFDGSLSSYQAPTLKLPQGGILGDINYSDALELFSPNTMQYVSFNYGYDQYIWADSNNAFIGTNWLPNFITGDLSRNWVFDKKGNITLPAFGGYIQANANVNTVYIQANSNSGAWAFTNANTLIFPDTTTMYGNTIIVTGTYNIQSTGNTLLQTSAAGGAKSWNFVTDGNLVFPDSTTQYTAFTNTAFAKINSAYGQANTAYGQANLAYSAANTAQTSSNTVYGQANAAYNQANAAYLAANNNIIDVFANSGLISANSANLTFNNTATVNAFVIANGSVGANIAFAVNTTINLISANITTANVGTLNTTSIFGVPPSIGSVALTIDGGIQSGSFPSGIVIKSNNVNLIYAGAGNVGIGGITSPTSNLHVSGNANISTNLIVGNSLSVSNINVSTINATSCSNISTLGVTSLFVSVNTTTANLIVTSNIANTGNLFVTQNTFTGNLSITQNTSTGNLTVFTYANISSLNVGAITGTSLNLSTTTGINIGNNATMTSCANVLLIGTSTASNGDIILTSNGVNGGTGTTYLNVSRLGVVTISGNLSVAANIANTGNLLVTQNTSTGNLSVTTLANVTTLNVGTITGFANVANATGTIANGIGANTVGYLGVPQNSQTGASYTLTTADQGKHVYVNYSATANITIPANATTSFPIGTTIALITANAATVNIASDTLIWANSGTTGNRSLTANAMASLIKVANTTWYVSGVGLS